MKITVSAEKLESLRWVQINVYFVDTKIFLEPFNGEADV